MSAMQPGQDRPIGDESPWGDDAEPEPEWADEIRRGRKERGRRLREIFATFGEDGPAATEPRRANRDEGDAS